MTDQQLLELAAKAVGMPSLHDANGIYGAWVGDHQSGHWWNPLEDDGDALRLMVALEISVDPDLEEHCCYVSYETANNHPIQFTEWGHDVLAATRTGIVRAAAEIGKAMQEKH